MLWVPNVGERDFAALMTSFDFPAAAQDGAARQARRLEFGGFGLQPDHGIVSVQQAGQFLRVGRVVEAAAVLAVVSGKPVAR